MRTITPQLDANGAKPSISWEEWNRRALLREAVIARRRFLRLGQAALAEVTGVPLVHLNHFENKLLGHKRTLATLEAWVRGVA